MIFISEEISTHYKFLLVYEYIVALEKTYAII
jgi:hypothetical protein